MQAPVPALAQGLEMNYPSVPSAYYATGQWLQGKQERVAKNLYAARFTVSPEGVDFINGVKGEKEKQVTIFDANMSFAMNDNPIPSKTKGMLWIQAPLPLHAKERLHLLTINSGKFLVFIRPSQLDDQWGKFREAYLKGALSCYGLRCSTAEHNPNAGENPDKIVTVHVEDAFDLDNVAKVAWQIDKVLGSWKGVVNFMTDRATMKRCNSMVHPEHAMLYKISSFTFIRDAKFGGTEKRTLDEFTATFKFKFTADAQCRQMVLAGSRVTKFTPPVAIQP